MLTLLLNNQTIPFANDFSCELVFKSPVCDFDKIPSGYGLGISIPINEHTRGLFGNPEMYSKQRLAGSEQKFTGFEIRVSGLSLMAGTLKITNCSDDAYECTLIDQVGTLGENNQEQLISELDAMSILGLWENKAVYNPDVDEFCAFPVRNAGFFTDKGKLIDDTRMIDDPENPGTQIPEEYETELLSYLFEVYPDVKSKVNALNPNSTIKQVYSAISLVKNSQGNYSGFVNVVTPFLFLNAVISKVLKVNQFSETSENYLRTHPALKNLCIFNLMDITMLGFSTSPNIGLYLWNTGEAKSNGYPVNAYERSYLPFYVPSEHLPKMTVGDLLLSTQNQWNVVFHFFPNNTYKVYSREQLILDRAVNIDRFFLNKWQIGEKKSVALHFVRERDDNDLIFKERFADLSDRKKDIKEGVASWSLLDGIASPELNEIRWCDSERVYAEYRWISETYVDPETKKEQTQELLGWAEISIGLQDGWYLYGRKEVEEIKSSWGTCHGTYEYPEVNQSGNTRAWKSKNIDFSPRLLFYNPYAGVNWGHNYYGGAGTTSENNVSMEYETEDHYDIDRNAILPRFWKVWNQFWANRLEVNGSFDLPLNVLFYMVNNICKKYRTREGEFFIDEMRVQLFLDHISPVDIKGWKVE